MTPPHNPATPGTWRIEVDRDRCMATGACAYAAPDVFAIEDNTATVAGPVDGTDATIRDIVTECPADAPRLMSTEG